MKKLFFNNENRLNVLMKLLTNFNFIIIKNIIRIRDKINNVVVVYYYFNFKNKSQNIMKIMFRSLLSQLLI